MTRSFSTAAATATLLLIAIPSAHARTHHHRHHAVMRAAPPPSVQAADKSFMFYPQDVEGGVSGNLPFNNQIRKHTDPLNANGGR